MSFSLRRIALLVLLAMVGPIAGCESKDRGKIEGKWKVVSMPEGTAEDKEVWEEMSKLGVYSFWEFQPYGDMTIGVWADKRELIDKITAVDSKIKFTHAKYKRLAGNSVEIFDLPKEMQANSGGLFGKKDRATVTIKITGDDMELTDDEGTAKLIRIK